MKTITERTLLPISFVITILGAVVWLTTIYTNGVTTAQAVSQLSIKQDEYNKSINKIDGRLSRIEGELGVTDKDH